LNAFDSAIVLDLSFIAIEFPTRSEDLAVYIALQ
jgi:hypothetical protein